MGSGSSKDYPGEMIRQQQRGREIEELQTTSDINFEENGVGIKPTIMSRKPMTVPNSNDVISLSATPTLDRKPTHQLISVGIGSSSGAKSAPSPGNVQMKDAEMDEAIAELEETFRDLEMDRKNSASPPHSSSSSQKNSHSSPRSAIIDPEYSQDKEDSARSQRLPQTKNANDAISDFQNAQRCSIPENRNNSSSDWPSTSSTPSIVGLQPHLQPAVLPGDNSSDSSSGTGTPLRIGYTTNTNGHSRPPQNNLGSRQMFLQKRARSQHGTSVNNAINVQLHVYDHQHHTNHPYNLQQYYQGGGGGGRSGENGTGHTLKRLQHSDVMSTRNASQILVIQQPKRRPEMLIVNRGSPSAPPNDSFSEWIYQPPKIEGFDIDKFKEVNRRDVTPISISLRLPSEDSIIPTLNKDSCPTYTKDELELIASLEKEIF